MANDPEDDDYKRLHELASSWVKESDSGKVHDAENCGRATRDRSRSPLRVAPISNAARAALDVVCKHDADPRVEEQRATIVRLQQELAAKDAEIADLRIGKGPIGPILVEKMKDNSSEEQRAIMLSRTESVRDFIWKMSTTAQHMHDEMVWGRSNYEVSMTWRLQ
jgi:hypothetical protein